jgi:hypothetical protein
MTVTAGVVVLLLVYIAWVLRDGSELKRAADLIKAEQQRAAVEAMFRPKG